MTHRGPFQPLLFCDSARSLLPATSVGDHYLGVFPAHGSSAHSFLGCSVLDTDLQPN